MNILVTGGTGFIGRPLCSFLQNAGHKLVIQTRSAQSTNIASAKTSIKSTADNSNIKRIYQLSQLNSNDKFDVVINLTGEPIADKRWSKKQKQEILRSRIDKTEELIQFFQQANNKPAVFISGSAIGYYGIAPSNNEINDDATDKEKGDDSFSSQLCQKWELSARQAEKLGIRTCLLRTGIVLGINGGALKKMLPPFKLGLGGKIGSGTQWMPWIHIDDMIGLIDLCINNKDISGAINCTAPNPVTNLTFTKTLAAAINRPAIFPMPAFVIKLLMGQMGEELLLNGKKVVPKKALDFGYQFKYQQLDIALKDIV
ncbi:epimerase [Psychrosphaera saromensis]|uniref:TIGR01777 family protein n=1 Tax=Psychrosphaera saromensis TaxID=716813 RepID=A0A2S7URC3_9GAMM|nr:TIGR01777 family oxidoreductase [Psychrosphaera saromensis]PQJ52526.1 TIGR01777 family protein [Psychrosphaera saromensis]GHB69190.1 epimerase [Psychrosphaera saromensis]GLQ12990.1 epimerase [Psychrosphaera saromensis]